MRSCTTHLVRTRNLASVAPRHHAGSVGTQRREDVDLLRGAVMILMALDHVRDFFSGATVDPLDLAHASPALFLTRWSTHFCAPVFVCLAGVSVRLSLERRGSVRDVAWFLLSRGVWLVVLELTVVRFGWFFDVSYGVLVGQVIWAIGWSMIALAGLVWLPLGAIATAAIALIAGHNLFDGVAVTGGGVATAAWAILHTGEMVPLGGGRVLMPVYPLVPWPGVMAIGYVIGAWLARGERTRIAWGGVFATVAFVGLRWSGVYGDARPWVPQPDAVRSILAFVDTTKYPPSLLYALMTLGPAFALLPFTTRLPAPVRRVLGTFGRVPLFYYVAHIYLIHTLAVVAAAFSGVPPAAWLTYAAPFRHPDGYGFSLPAVYAVWAVVVAALYPASVWFAGVKARRRDWWLSYL